MREPRRVYAFRHCHRVFGEQIPAHAQEEIGQIPACPLVLRPLRVPL
jgi:hypothetical protein